MYYFGKITSIPTPDEKGIITGIDKKNYFYETSDYLYPVSRGKICAFQLFHNARQKNIPRKIQRAFLSKDKRFIIDRPKSHLHDGITPELLKIICAQITCNKLKLIRTQINFEKVIGTTNCVPITEKDEVVYAQRVGRYGHSKFVLNREPEPTKSATIVLKKALQHYKILTSYIGTRSELEPKDRRATLASIRFWEEHALVFGSEPIQENTITKECPWSNRNLKE